MIETNVEVSKDLEKALQVLEQAKQRVANEKKKQNEKKRRAEKHHKYIMGGIGMKYFPECYSFDEDELNRILSVVLRTKECQQVISKIKSECRESTPPQSTIPNADKLVYAKSIVFLATAKRGKGQQADLHNSPSQAELAQMFNVLCYKRAGPGRKKERAGTVSIKR